MVKPKASWRGLDRLLKNVKIIFMAYKPGCYMVINSYNNIYIMHSVNTRWLMVYKLNTCKCHLIWDTLYLSKYY